MKADQDHMLPVARSVPGESTPQPAQASGISSGPADLAGARDSVRTSSSDNTRRAYAGDWKHYTAWCRRQSLAVLPPDPRIVSLYLTACALGNVTGDKRPNSTSTIERRLSSLSWNYAQRGQPLDRKDLQITTVMARIRSTRAKPPARKEAVRQEDIIAMLETLDRGSLRGIRDRAILLIGFAGRLRRSEIVGLDVDKDQTHDGRGWIEILDKGLLVTVRGKNRIRSVEISRSPSDATCPVAALEMWLKFAKINHGPIFRRVTGQGRLAGSRRLNDQEVARLVKRTALSAGMRGDLAEHERARKFSGHSLRASLPSLSDIYDGKA